MDLADTLVNTANQAKEYDPSLKPSIYATMDKVAKTITDGSAPGSAGNLQLKAKSSVSSSVILLQETEKKAPLKKGGNKMVQKEAKIDMKVFDKTP